MSRDGLIITEEYGGGGSFVFVSGGRIEWGGWG